MSVIAIDAGFVPDDCQVGFADLETVLADTSEQDVALDLAAETTLEDLARLGPDFDRISLIRIRFTNFADGRGFTLARQLRLTGYRGRLRASGHLIADQYAMVRRSGFDEVEIGAALAVRQPQEQWRARSAWQANHYQTHLGMREVGAAEGMTEDE